MRFRKVLPTLALASTMMVGGVMLPEAADAKTNVTVSLGDSRYGSFRSGLGTYFGMPEDQILSVNQRGLSPSEVPVALFIANRARVSPAMVADLRLRGLRWHDIMHHFGLSPGIFYVPVDRYSGPYSQMYRYPVSRWDNLSLSDEDYVNLANLKFMTDQYGYEPGRIIELRSQGNDFFNIANLIGNVIGGALQGDRYGYGAGAGALDAFLGTASSYFGTPYDDVYSLEQRGLSESEIPVALYLSSYAGVSPLTIADMRLSGMPWMDITRRYDLSPEIYYYPMQGINDSYYGRVYNEFESRPRYEWRSLRLSDQDVINLANLRFATEAYRMDPQQVIRLRSQGTDFPRLHDVIRDQISRQTGVNTGRQVQIYPMKERQEMQGRRPMPRRDVENQRTMPRRDEQPMTRTERRQATREEVPVTPERRGTRRMPARENQAPEQEMIRVQPQPRQEAVPRQPQQDQRPNRRQRMQGQPENQGQPQAQEQKEQKDQKGKKGQKGRKGQKTKVEIQ